LLAEGFGQPLGHPEHAPRVANFFPHTITPLVGRHRVVQGAVDRLRHGHVGNRRHRRQNRAPRLWLSSPFIAGR